jgi:ABC-type Fe3+-hydroxamate transport system substrate-binding protein
MYCVSTDQTGRTIALEQAPFRIISLVPSQTELLADLGLENEVVGITKFCIHPESWYRSKTRVGGTKDFKTELIRSLHPDLIIANKEENDRERLESLMNDFPVWISDVHDLPSALSMIQEVGRLCNRAGESDKVSAFVASSFDALDAHISLKKKAEETCIYYIWKDPWLCAGSDTFIADMLRRCGLKVIPEHPRYPEVNPSALHSDPPELILLSSEPFPFRQEHFESLQQFLPKSRVLLVDGEYFSWYGSRLKTAVPYFLSLFG